MVKLAIALLLSKSLILMNDGARFNTARKPIKKLGDRGLDGDPACNFDVPKSKCPCSTFYDELVKECLTVVERSRENCVDLVFRLWNNDDLKEDLLGFKTFISSDSSFLSESTKTFIVPLFWAGFSWTLGTRFVLDEMIKNISSNSQGYFEMRDIEHANSPIGRVMRKLNWDRHCHNTKHDSKFWLSMSQEFARGVAHQSDAVKKDLLDMLTPVGGELSEAEDYLSMLTEGILKISKTVYIAINYKFHRLQTSFLFQHEMPLLGAFNRVTILDLKNLCDEAMIGKIRSQIWKKEISSEMETRTMLCVDGSARRKGASESLYLGLDEHERQALGKIVQDAQRQIRGLEDGHARGMIWKREDMQSQKQVANFMACQEACNSERNCNFFNYNEATHECEVFHRNDRLQYLSGNPWVISGHRKS